MGRRGREGMNGKGLLLGEGKALGRGRRRQGQGQAHRSYISAWGGLRLGAIRLPPLPPPTSPASSLPLPTGRASGEGRREQTPEGRGSLGHSADF